MPDTYTAAMLEEAKRNALAAYKQRVKSADAKMFSLLQAIPTDVRMKVGENEYMDAREYIRAIFELRKKELEL